MIKFNKSTIKDDRYTSESFTITVDGQKNEYIETIKALVGVLGGVEDDFISQRDRYLLCNLIEDMLPDADQILNIEDAERFKRLKND